MTKQEFLTKLTKAFTEKIETLPEEMLNVKSFILAIGVITNDKVFSTSTMQGIPPPEILGQLIIKMNNDLQSHLVLSCECHSTINTTINYSNSNNLIN